MVAKTKDRAPCPSCRDMGGDRQGNNLVTGKYVKRCFACGYQETLSPSLYSSPIPTHMSSISNTYVIHMDRVAHNQEDVKSFLKDDKDKMTPYTLQYVPTRGVTRETFEFYKVKTRVRDDGTPIAHEYPYGNAATKVRVLDPKGFYWEGQGNDAALFGMDRFEAGGAKAITITEGEIDCLSAFQMLGSKYPVVSIRGSSSAALDCTRARDYLSSFDHVYLCFDSDKAGQDAIGSVARLFHPNKIRIVSLTKYKDANEYLDKGAGKDFVSAWWAAKPYLPKEIISGRAAIEEIFSKEDQGAIASYPFATLDTMSYGIRSGELVLFTAQQKVGKTEVLRAIEHHILSTTQYNIGIIHLEENERRTVQGLASYVLNVPTHLPDSNVSKSDVLSAYASLAGEDNSRVFLYSSFGSNDPETILDRIRYLVTACSCKFIFLDHMTRLVSSNMEDDLRRTLDYLATTFAIMCKELDFTLFLVCHVNDEGQPRDSRMIAKECNLHVYFSRDKENADAAARNTVSVMVRDNRFSGSTGPAGELEFNPKTFKLTEKPPVVDMEVTYDPTI